MTTTTHKTLRGPRSGIIFFRKTNRSDNCANDLESRVNNAVFPCLQVFVNLYEFFLIDFREGLIIT